MTISLPSNRVTRHERERCQFQPRTLHERMMVEAEPLIQHNWLDVAIHDKQRLDALPVGCFAYWLVGPLGSHFSPAFCSLADRDRWTQDRSATIAPIQILLIRWHGQSVRMRSNRSWLTLHNPAATKQCYLVRKTDSHGGGELTQISYQELAALALYDHIPTQPPTA